MNHALVVYSPTTGEIVAVYYGRDELIEGVPCMFIDIPYNAILVGIELGTLRPSFRYYSNPTLESLQEQILTAQSTGDMAATNASAAIGNAQNNSDAIDSILIYLFGGE